MPVYCYAQSTPEQSKEEKKRVEQEKKAQEKQAKEQKKQQAKQAKVDAKAAKNSAPAQFQRDYDKFTNKTAIRFITATSKQSINEGVTLDLGVTLFFKGSTDPQNIEEISILLVLSYRITADSQVGDRGLILLVDNEPIDFGQLTTDHSSTRKFGSLVTFTDAVLYTKISYETYKRLANAQTIEGRFSGVEFQVSPNFIPTLREMLK
jgi:hypothetical protein